MVGKYTELSDAYLSITKALQHACMAANRKLQLEWVEASNLEPVEAGQDGKEGDKGTRRWTSTGWGWRQYAPKACLRRRRWERGD